MHGRKPGGQNDTDTHEGRAQKIQLQSLHCNLLQLLVLFSVENRSNGIGEDQSAETEQGREDQSGDLGVFHAQSASSEIVDRCSLGNQRLYPLTDTIEDGCGHTGCIGNHAIGCHAHVAGEFQEDAVEDHHDHSGRKLSNQRGKAQGEVRQQNLSVRFCRHHVKGIPAGSEMHQHHQNAAHRRKTGGQNGTKHAHVAGEDKEPVQDNVQKLPASMAFMDRWGLPSLRRNACRM